MRTRIFVAIALCLALVACRKSMQVQPLPSGQSVAHNLQPQAAYVDWTVYSSWDCSVRWNEECGWQGLVQAPAGFEVCRPYYTVTHAGRGKPPHEGITRGHYSAVFYSFDVKGSGNPLNKWGSNLNIVNIGMRLVTAGTTQKDRDAAGCRDRAM